MLLQAARQRAARPALPMAASAPSTRSWRVYRPHARLGAAPSAADARRHARHDGRDGLSLRHRPQGLLPAAGHRPADRARSWPTRTPPSRRWTAGSGSSRTSCSRIPAVDVRSRRYAGGGSTPNTGADVRHPEAARPSARSPPTQVIARLRPKLAHIPGATLYLQSVQDLRIGGRPSARPVPVHARGRQTSRELQSLGAAGPASACARLPELARRQQRPAEQGAARRRSRSTATTAARLGITPQAIDDTLYDAFGQRQVSTMYTAAQPVPRRPGGGSAVPGRARRPGRTCYVRSVNDGGGLVPLSAFTHYEPSTAPLPVNHQGQFPSVTISFNLAAGQLARRRGRRDRAGRGGDRPAGHDPRQLPGHGAGVPGLAARTSRS